MEYQKVPHPKWVQVLFFVILLGGSALVGLFIALGMQGH